VESSAFSDDWKKETIRLIAEDHERRGLPYYTDGPERDKRAKEAHEGVQPVMKKGVIIGVSDIVTDALIEADPIDTTGQVDNG
jgi:hypothetical protein